MADGFGILTMEMSGVPITHGDGTPIIMAIGTGITTMDGIGSQDIDGHLHGCHGAGMIVTGVGAHGAVGTGR